MKLKNEFKKDTLERKKIAKQYVSFINKLDGNHTIALDAAWGSGKTKFIEFMEEEFDSKKDIYITYNAWDNDYTDDPFLSLMSEFFNQIVEKEYVGEDKLKDVMAATLAASKIIGIGAMKGLIKNLFDQEELEKTSNALEDILKGTLSETSNEIIANAFKNIHTSKKTRKEFTKKLHITTEKILKEKDKNRLIIIIDELDRCKPTFAIELLENIKHLFNIKEITFFIAIDKTQLVESIKSVYGAGFDANTYLQRFFDFELHLLKANIIHHFKDFAKEYLKMNMYSGIPYIKILEDAIELFDITLRDFERISAETKLLYELNDTRINKRACILLLIYKYKAPEVYNIIINNTSMGADEIHRKIISIKTDKNISTFFETAKHILEDKNTYKLDTKVIELINLIKTTV